MEKVNSTSVLGCSRRRKHCAGSVAGICNLPDSILGHILSFLPTKNLVATSILSQRWKFLWAMTNNLDFHIRDDKVDQDVRFVNHVLLLHKPGYMNKLSLTWYVGCIPYYVNTWISAAIARNVRELFLCFGLSKLPIQVQRSMFSYEELRSLELVFCGICISDEIEIFLPRLESLSLSTISFQSEETLCKLLGGCPVLKYLCIEIDIIKTMEYCRLDKDNGIEFRCIISSDSLKHLQVNALDSFDPISAPLCCVQLDAPLLEYLRLDEISSICVHQNLVFLVEANIDLLPLQPVFEDQKYFNSVAKVFRSFDSVKTLTLSLQVIWALSRATIEMKTRFNSLTRLELTRVRNWSSLQEFITMADNLEFLTITMNYGSLAEARIGSKSDLVPRCLSNSLRTVTIGGYDDIEDGVAMVGYILKHGSVLELMVICLELDELEANYKVVKEISYLPRKSPICKVEFSDIF